MPRWSVILFLFAAMPTGCHFVVPLRGRTFGTDNVQLAGIRLVDTAVAVDAFEASHPDVWPLGEVVVNDWARVAVPRTSDPNGSLVDVGVYCSHAFLFPIKTRLRCEKKGYHTEGKDDIPAQEIEDKFVIVVLLRSREVE